MLTIYELKTRQTQNASPVLKFDIRNKTFSKIFLMSLAAIGLMISFHTQAQDQCADLFGHTSLVSVDHERMSYEELLIDVQNDPQYEIRMTGEELAADVLEAVIRNPNGFGHRDAEKAILANLGDLAGEASEYQRQSNLWSQSEELSKSMTQLEYATASFLSASKSYKRLSGGGWLATVVNKLPFVSGDAGYKQRRLKDLVQSLQESRYRAELAGKDINLVMDSFEKLSRDFAGHSLKMERSISILENAILNVETSAKIDKDQRTNATLALQRYLQAVTTSIGVSTLGLKGLHMTYTGQDLLIKQRINELRTATDLMVGLGVAGDIYQTPFYVESVLRENKNIRPDLVDVFYSQRSHGEIMQEISRIVTNLSPPLTIDEVILIAKLMPKGTDVRANLWAHLTQGINSYVDPTSGKKIFSNKGNDWSNSNDLRSRDIEIMLALLETPLRTTRHAENAVDKIEFLRLDDYLQDLLDESKSLKSDGLAGKLKDSISGYLHVKVQERMREILAVLEKEKKQK